MAKKKAVDPITAEIDRLNAVYIRLPANKLAVAQGLITQAARLRVHLDNLQKEIEQNGLTEWFSQSESQAPYQRTRPCADLFVKLDKNYQSVMKQLNDLCPPESTGSALADFKAANKL